MIVEGRMALHENRVSTGEGWFLSDTCAILHPGLFWERLCCCRYLENSTGMICKPQRRVHTDLRT